MTSNSIFWGSSAVSVVYLEVVPVVVPGGPASPELSNFSVKHALQKLTQQSQLFLSSAGTPNQLRIEWRSENHGQGTKTGEKGGPASGTEGSTEQTKNGLGVGFLSQDPERARTSSHLDGADKFSTVPIFFLDSSDLSIREGTPCILRAYATRSKGSVAMITSATLVRILPMEFANFISDSNLQHLSCSDLSPSTSCFRQELLSGESGRDFLPRNLQVEVLCNHNPETIRELSLRMNMQCSRFVRIGTTKDAFRLRKQAMARSRSMRRSIESRVGAKIDCDSHFGKETPFDKGTPRSIPREASLLIHSPNHADGKTMLVQAIAKQIGCARIHLISPGPLLAKYGIHADTALESMLHGLLVSAAVQPDSAPVCIILDHLDSMMPPQLSGRSGAGDSAMPVFNAIASYLRNVTESLQKFNEFPFPLKNPMYNVGGSHGRVLPVRFCLVGIVTCPDDGWRSLQRGGTSVALAAGGGGSTILNFLSGGRYRLPPLTAATRHHAFLKAFERMGIGLDDNARKQFPILAASAAWAKGSTFQRVANILADDAAKEIDGNRAISVPDLERAIASVQASSAGFAHVSFHPSSDLSPGNETSEDMFDSVGGNMQAKQSLEDALALDPDKRRMLARFGLSPPTGILLYGPPGTGKTMLAKAVARLLQSSIATSAESPTSLGGTFISLGSSDLVRAEIGTSEKLLVSAFDFADKNAPSVVFLDEFQALFTERSRGGSSKLASTLLQCLDDIKRWSQIDSLAIASNGSIDESPRIASRVVVLGATNTPWMVDSAFLRPGRFDRVVHVGLPTLGERMSILKVHASRMKIRYKKEDRSLERLCMKIAELTDGFSGADLAALCRAAAIRALWDDANDGWIEESYFRDAFENDIQSSSDEALVARLLAWKP